MSELAITKRGGGGLKEYTKDDCVITLGAYASTWWTLGLPSGVTWADVEFMYIYANDTRYIYARGNRLTKNSTNSYYVEDSTVVFPAPAATDTTIRLQGTASSGYTPICNTVQIVARK